MLLLLQQPLFIINQASVTMQIKKPSTASSSIENASQLFKEIKQFMKMRSTNKIGMYQFKQFYHNTTDQALGRIMMYINSKTRFDKSLPNEQCANILRTLLAEDKGVNGKFRISSQEMVYESKYIKIVDKKTLLQEIQNNPQGLQVTEEILKFAGTDVRDHIQELIYQRAIIPVKSKAIEKGKIKGNNYEGYLLFPIPSEVKEVLPIILEPQMKKNDFESQAKNLEERQEKLKRVYRTKTSVFRTDFDNICIQNVGRGQGKIGQNQNLQSIQRIFGGWNEINKMSVPNFDRQAEQWYKNRK